MMKLALVFLPLVFPIFQAWEIEKKYEYRFQNRIFVNAEAKNLGVGLFQFKWESENLLTGRLIPKHISNLITFENFLVFPKKSFQVVFKNGLVVELKVAGEANNWQIEFIRGIIGLLQICDLAKEEDEFSITEESVAGVCKTHYTVVRNSPVIEITKIRNYTDCEKIPFFERGIYGTDNFDALMNKNDIISKGSKGVFHLKNGHEIQTAAVEEKIEVIYEKKFVEFISEVKLSRDLSKMEYEKDPSDNADFEIGNLISVGGLMYRPKPQSSFCDLNGTDSNCEFDYYMNPKQFGILYDGEEVSIAEKLVKQIAKEIETPNEIPEKNTLDRFIILVEVVRQMNLTRLEDTSKLWKSQGFEAFVFDSALFQAGTLESLEMIKTLRKRKHLKVNQILINELPGKVHPLRLKYLDTLFEFATDSELKENNFSKEIFLAFSNLVRRYLTEKEKPFEQKELNKMISAKYRKYLSKKLQMAINQKDDLTFQICVQALSNMADLALFKSFFSRNAYKLTSFQKTFFVNSMDKTVELYPKKSRDVLISIYKNSNETFPVRTAAIFQLVKTDLPEDVVLEIIKIANRSEDLKIQLAVKFSVMSKAFNYHMNNNISESFQTMQINLKQLHFDRQFDLFDFSVKEFETDFLTETIRWDGNSRSVFSHAEVNRNGFRSSFRFSGIIDKLQDYLFRYTNETFSNAGFLNASSFNLVIENDFTQIFLPFVNFNFSVTDIMRSLHDHKISKNSLLTMNEVAIAFPTESGLPFFYSCQRPKFFSYEGAINVEDSYNFDVNFIWSDRTQIKMGFVNPLTKKFYVQGIGIDRHFNIPIVISYKKIESFHRNTNVFIMEPLFRSENKRILRLATRPYTEIQDFYLVEPATRNEHIANISREDLFCDARFRVKFVSSKSGPNGTVENYLKRPELKAYFSSTAFGGTEHIFNVFEIFFNDIPKHRTSLTAELDLPNTKAYATKKGENSSSVEEQKIFEVVFQLSGPTTRAAALESLYEFELYSKAYRITARGSYWENNAKLYEALFFYVFQKSKQKIWPNLAQDQSQALYGIGNDTIEIFSKLSFGETLERGNFISAESEIMDPLGFATNPNELFNVTVDFHGLPTKILKEVCQFEGDFFLGKLIASNMKVVRKNPEKCRFEDL